MRSVHVDSHSGAPTKAWHDTSPRKIFLFVVIVGLIVGGVIRSALATQLDSFHIDETYHITSGVSYLRLGDYRLNPEHPPLVKLWVAAFLPKSFFYLPSLRRLSDKIEERHFTADAVHLKNDPDRVQQRVRLAMFLLNGMLLLGFGLTVWGVFDPIVALGAIAFLIIDPTVAAHMPLVLTDLPMALLASTAVLLAFSAFRTWRARDLALTGVVLGLVFADKHSAPVVLAAVALLGTWLALRGPRSFRDRALRLARVLAMLVLAWIVLWSFYRFRFNESPIGRDLFNRPLANKIADVNSPALRKTISVMSDIHLLPRAYLWGLADITRAGVEGRIYAIYFWNRYYIRKTPFYFFPVLILAKLPIGLSAVCAIGLALMFTGRVPSDWRAAFGVMMGLVGLLLLMLALANSSYAGIRHALPVFPALAVFAGVAAANAVQGKSRLMKIAVALLTAVALISAMPVIRPWEYYNEIAAGPANAFHRFNDEGLEAGQRVKELATYYHQQLEPKGIVPYVDYWFFFHDEEFKRRGIRTLQNEWDHDESSDTSDLVSDTIVVNAKWLAPDPWFDYPPLRSAQSIERFGNLLVYRGSFHLPKQRAWRLFLRGLAALYSDKPDLARAERLLRAASATAPELYFINIELGNLLAQRGDREEAIRAYTSAKTYAPAGESILGLLTQQIERISREDAKSIPPIRDPILE
jgi:tetratricopeptide (TPR) repeat protein